MKLDNENDRAILLGLIENSQISGRMVFAVADLVKRIQQADIDGAIKPADTKAS